MKHSSKTLQVVAAKLKADCQPYLKATEFYAYPLYRGLRNTNRYNLAVAKCPVNRPPRDTNLAIHEIADTYFYKNFGAHYRSGAFFVTGSQEEASMYGDELGGETFLFFPMGAFKFCWSPRYADFYADLENEIYGEEENEFIWSDSNLGETVVQYIERGHYRTNDIKNATRSGHEIMLTCASAYLLKTSFQYQFEEIQYNIKRK